MASGLRRNVFRFYEKRCQSVNTFFVRYDGGNYYQYGRVVFDWAYSFFEANNLGGLPDEEFHRVEDKYMFGLDSMEMDSIKNSLMGKYRKGLAIVLILLGINLLWNVICDILYDIFYMFELSDYFYEITSSIGNGVTRVAIGVAIIWFGVKLIKGKKVELEEAEKVEEIGDGK